MNTQIQHRQKRQRITLPPIRLDARPHQRLPQHQLRQPMQPQRMRLRIGLEQLAQEPEEGVIIDRGVRVEKFEVDVDGGGALLARLYIYIYSVSGRGVGDMTYDICV